MMVLSGGSLAQFPASTCSRLVVRQAQGLRQRPRAPKKLQPQVSRRRSLLCRAYADGANTLDALDEADDFYSILGVVCLCHQSALRHKQMKSTLIFLLIS